MVAGRRGGMALSLLVLQLMAVLAAPPPPAALLAGAPPPPATLLDPAGIPFVPMGFYSGESLTDTASNIREFRHGPNAVGAVGLFPRGPGSATPQVGCDGAGACDWALIHKWLNRSDAVGSAVVFGLAEQYGAALHNTTLALAAMTEIVGQVKHHPSIVAWYIADEPDGAITNVTLTNANAEV